MGHIDWSIPLFGSERYQQWRWTTEDLDWSYYRKYLHLLYWVCVLSAKQLFCDTPWVQLGNSYCSIQSHSVKTAKILSQWCCTYTDVAATVMSQQRNDCRTFGYGFCSNERDEKVYRKVVQNRLWLLLPFLIQSAK